MSWPGNIFLSHFGQDLDLIAPRLRRVTLGAGQVLNEPGEPIRRVYFLEGGVASKLTVFQDGTEIESALIGRKGAVGAMAALGLRTAATRDICHMRVSALALDVAELAELVRRSEEIHGVLDRYCTLKTSHAIRSGACNACHPIGQRLCRWLLTCSDVLESRDIRLPQDLFAKMLGVQRTSVNPILRRLSAQGLIELGRARVTLLSRGGLEAQACECYHHIRELENGMWSGHSPGADRIPARRSAANGYALM